MMAKRLLSSSKLLATSTKSQFHQSIDSSLFPCGYLLTGVHAGIKKSPGSLDLGLILSTSLTTSAAACFTKNAFKAAPVLVSEQVLRRTCGRASAIVVNSGCANAVTGQQGLDNAWKMANETSLLAGDALVMSTGVIGQHLPISKILQAIQSQERDRSTCSLGSDFAAWERAAKAFMTTDTFPKLRAREFTIDGVKYRIAGMDKGAGMIHPVMGPPASSLHATLLGCILTDAPVDPASLQNALTYAVDRSFNSISVDGDMSTNDTIIALANGTVTPGSGEIHETNNPNAFAQFREVLTNFAIDLAKLVVRDGEGATKFVTVTVKGGHSYKDAHKVASRISTSPLVKTAFFGQDANWGRILAATGSVPLSLPVDPSKVSVTFVPSDGSPCLPVLVNGEPVEVEEGRALEILKMDDFEVDVDLGIGGSFEAKYYTCDFSYEYVRINGDYTNRT